MPVLSPKREITADRIIAAAGVVFAERGFRATTIRQITTRAGVNVAAVNYHFKNKNELYVCVLRKAKKQLPLIVIEEIPGPPEERLKIFISRFVHYLLDPNRPLWHGRVLAMEMANPTPALGIIVRELTAPLFQNLRKLIGQVLGGTAGAAELDLFTFSIIGQCVFYVCSRPMVAQLGVHLNRVSGRVDRIADHIGCFSVAALKKSGRREAKSSRLQRALT